MDVTDQVVILSTWSTGQGKLAVQSHILVSCLRLELSRHSKFAHFWGKKVKNLNQEMPIDDLGHPSPGLPPGLRPLVGALPSAQANVDPSEHTGG